MWIFNSYLKRFVSDPHMNHKILFDQKNTYYPNFWTINYCCFLHALDPAAYATMPMIYRYLLTPVGHYSRKRKTETDVGKS